MSEEIEQYYILVENWSLDPNQWSMVMDGTAVILTLLGFIIAFVLYRMQRNDNSEDARRFFQASLPELKASIVHAISDLEAFTKSLELDNVVDPVLSVSLNDNFLQKVNLVALNRYYVSQEREKLPYYIQLLVDSNFFGDYRNYITDQVKYFRTAYLEKQQSSQPLEQMKKKIKNIVKNDISRFRSIVKNLEALMD